MGRFTQGQLDRIAQRAGDPARRTFTSGAEAAAKPVDMGGLADDLRRHGAPGAKGLLGLVGRLGGMLGGAVAMGPDGPVRFGGKAPPEQLAPPVDGHRLDEAAHAIGRPLPEDLRQLYAIGDGGFGPGDGLLPLSEAVTRYREMTGKPFGPLEQDWPANLLVIFDEDPVLLCLDLDDGRIVAWDPEEIEDEEREEDWQASFRPEHASLAALMDDWLGSETFEESSASLLRKAEADYRAKPPSPVTGFPMELPPEQQAEGEVEFLRHSKALRDDFGLPEVGWEDEIRRRHGLL